MPDLQVLRGVFDVDESARTVFHVNRSAGNQLLHLPAAQVQRRVQRPRRSAVHEVVAVAFDATAQRGIPRDVSQLDPRLPLKRRGGSSRPAITLDVFK